MLPPSPAPGLKNRFRIQKRPGPLKAGIQVRPASDRSRTSRPQTLAVPAGQGPCQSGKPQNCGSQLSSRGTALAVTGSPGPPSWQTI
jgi:hypothetical protein